MYGNVTNGMVDNILNIKAIVSNNWDFVTSGLSNGYSIFVSNQDLGYLLLATIKI